MVNGEIGLRQALLRAATTLEQVRVICDRTHEENILAAREGRNVELACHYAFAMGAVMYVVMQELDRLQLHAGVRRADLHEQASALATAQLESFKRSLQQLQGSSGHGD